MYRWFPKAYAKLDNTAQLKKSPTLFDIFSKNVNPAWCFEETVFKFYGNDVETLRQHIEVSQRFYIVANSAGKVDRNCKL